MKKLFSIFLLLTVAFICNAQSATLLTAVTATTSITGVITTAPRVQIMNIQTYTNSAYSGTTATVALKGSNDGVSWATLYADDNTTALSFTITAASTSYDWLVKAAMYKYYLVIYTKGNASAGTITTTYNQQ